MTKAEFYEKLKEALEMEEIISGEQTPVNLTSLQTLALIAFADENFSRQLKVANLKEVKTISDIIELIGRENFTC